MPFAHGLLGVVYIKAHKRRSGSGQMLRSPAYDYKVSGFKYPFLPCAHNGYEPIMLTAFHATPRFQDGCLLPSKQFSVYLFIVSLLLRDLIRK
jgi:hypothetical protein